MKKIEVGILTNVIDNRKARGTALSIRRFLEQLHNYEDRFSFTLIHSQKTDDPLYRRYKEILIPQTRIPFARQFLSETFFWIRRIISRESRFDIFHYPHPRIWPSYLLTRARKIIVTAFEGGIMLDIYSPTLGDRIFRLTNRFLNWRMNSLIACSDSGRTEIIQYYGVKPERVSTILLGIDSIYSPVETSTARNSVSQLLGINSKYFLVMSRFDPHKNILRLIEAYRQVIAKHKDVHLVCVGGSHTPGHSQQVEAAIKQVNEEGGHIHVIPFVEDEHMPALYSSTLALVYPSLHEGFGLPVAEAMACGAPVICSNSTSLPEVAGAAALYVNPLDTSHIAQSMLRIINEPELVHTLSRAGLEQSKKFSWKKMADQTIHEYEKVSAMR